MKRGTASRVVIGGNTMLDLPKGLVFGTDVILGGIAGLTSDFNGLVLSNTLMLGKKISHISVITVIVRGQSPLNLPYAIADSLHYVKAFGGTELLPKTYLDTVTLSGGCEQRNLPVGYTEYSYIRNTESSSLNQIDLDIIDDVDDMVYELEIENPSTGSWYILQSRELNDQKICGISGPQKGNYISAGVRGTSLSAKNGSDYVTRDGTGRYFIRFVHKNGAQSLTVTDLNTGVVYTDSNTYTYTSATVPLCIFVNNVGNAIAAGNKIKHIRIYKSGALARDLYPANDGTKGGMYDNASNRMFLPTAQTYIALDDLAVPSPDTPMDIVSNNGALKYGYRSANMFDKNSALADNRIWAPNFTQQDLNGYYGTNIIKVIGGHTYTRSGSHGGAHYFKLSDGTYMQTSDSNATITVPNNAVEWVFNNTTATDRETMMVVEGNSLPEEYVPYEGYGIYTDGTVEQVTDSDGLTATAEMLLAVSDYKDTQEVLSGSVTKNIGIKVMTGDETFQVGTNGWISDDTITDNLNATYTPICTHFDGTDTTPTENSNTVRVYYTSQNIPRVYFGVDKTIYTSAEVFKQYLADQYNAGTPVIIIYPLATATTETVSPQVLEKEPITQTAGSISNLDVTAVSSSHTTPTPQKPLQINCNNGVLKYGFNYYSYNVTRQLSVANYPTELDRSVSYSDGVLTCGITGSVGANRGLYPTWNMSFTAGHKYACVVMAKGDTRINLGVASIIPSGSVTGGSPADGFYTLTSDYAWYAKRWECNTDSSVRLNIRVAGTDVGQYASFKDILVIDLTAIFGAGNEPTTSKDIIQRTVKIYTDGTVETIGIRTRNLYDANSNKAFVEEDTQYTISLIKTAARVNIAAYDTNDTLLEVVATWSSAQTGAQQTTFTTPENTKYIACATGLNLVSNVQIEQGSAATDYVPYFDGGTATAEMLLKVGDYKDTQEVLSGSVTKNIGIKVMTGDETFQVGTNGWISDDTITDNLNATYTPICTHFDGTDTTPTENSNTVRVYYTSQNIPRVYFGVDKTIYTSAEVFKQYLADQYNAGAPVIIVYPLATPTTESVTGQTLQVQEGNNILEITQASMNGLELEASYDTGVVAIIQEVQDVNLNNNVTVTIE